MAPRNKRHAATEEMPESQEVIEVRRLLALLEASPLWAGKFTGADCREERPGSGQGGEGFILHQAEGEEEADQLQLAIALKVTTAYLNINKGSSVKAWTVKGSPIGIDFINTRDAMHQLEKGINSIGVKGRDMRPGMVFPEMNFTQTASDNDLDDLRLGIHGDNLGGFPGMYDARGVDDLNDTDTFKGNPDMVVLFAPTIWRPRTGGNIAPSKGGSKMHSVAICWSASFRLVAIYLLGHSDGGEVSKSLINPKRPKRF